MKKLHVLGGLLVGLVLIGAGCTTTSTAACVTDTTWGSCINENQSDTGLLGSWTLVEQQIATPTTSISNPFKGRTLVLTENDGYNGYSEDWSNETAGKTATAGTPSVEHTSTCDAEGTLTGSWAAVENDGVFELWIVPSGGNSPSITCQNSTFAGDGLAETASAASTPLGVGMPDIGPTGDPYVKYTYAIGDGGTLLSVVQELPGGAGSNVFLFQR